jgi:hypothetical protein
MTAINPLLAKLTAQQAALGDGRDKRSEVEKADHFAAYKAHAETISGLMNAPSDLAAVQTKLADLEAEHALTAAKQTEIEQEIAAAPDPQSIRDGRERDKEQERQRQLRLSLERLANGTLLRAPDVMYRPLAHLDGRIKELTERRDRAQRALDGYIAAAEQLLAAASVSS